MAYKTGTAELFTCHKQFQRHDQTPQLYDIISCSLFDLVNEVPGSTIAFSGILYLFNATLHSPSDWKTIKQTGK